MQYYLWHAVDQRGVVLDILVQQRWERIVISAVGTDITEPISPALHGIIEAVCYAP